MLWIAALASAVLFLTGDAHVSAALVPPIACGACWLLAGIGLGPGRRAARWLVFASPPSVLVGLAAANWLLLIA